MSGETPAPARAGGPPRGASVRVLAWVALSLVVLAMPPASLFRLVTSDDPWIVYDEYVMPEAAMALAMGQDPAVIMGTPNALMMLAGEGLVLAGAPRSPAPAVAPGRLERAAERLDERCRELLLDPRPLVVPLRWAAVACVLAAAFVVGRLACGLAGSAGLAPAAAALLLLQPVTASMTAPSYGESTGLLALSLSLALAVRGARRFDDDATSGAGAAAVATTTWLLAGACAGLAGASKANFGASAALGTGAWLAFEWMRARRADRGAALGAFVAGTAVAFLAACPLFLARTTAFVKAQIFSVVVYGGMAREASGIARQVAEGFGLLAPLGAAAVVVALRSRRRDVALLAWSAVAYGGVLVAMRFAKLPWFLPALPALAVLAAWMLAQLSERSRMAARILLAATLVAGAALAVRTLAAANGPASSGRALRAWARERLPGAGPALVVGRHLELPPLTSVAQVQAASLASLRERRERELPRSLAGPLLIEERWDELRLRLLSVAAPDDPPRHDVWTDVAFAPDELRSVVAQRRFERVIGTAGDLERLGVAAAGYDTEASFPRDPAAPSATSFDLVVMRRR